MADLNPFTFCLKTLTINEKQYSYYDLSILGEQYYQLPYSIKILLEAAVRNCDDFYTKQKDVFNILNWEQIQKLKHPVEIPFKPARVLLHDVTGISAFVDFAAMRDAVENLGGDPKIINCVSPVDLVIDHSVQVDFARSSMALKKNQELELKRYKERYIFLKWCAQAFNNILLIPPGCGICHHINLEYLARVIFVDEDKGILYPDTLVGNDSHTTTINGLGVLGWGVGGIEGEAVMLGHPIKMLLPEVIGYKLHGTLGQYVTSTDLVLTITNQLRQVGVVGKFIEFFGSGVETLSVAERATIANMCPEYGATAAFFPTDQVSLEYLKQTNRSKEKVLLLETYLRATHQLRDYSDITQQPVFSQIISLDLSTIELSVSGPKRPEDRIPLSLVKRDFIICLLNKIGLKGYGIPRNKLKIKAKFWFNGTQYSIKHGSIIIAAITSCTNTGNPNVMLGAGLLARNAVTAGLTVAPYIKTSLSPGSEVVSHYLKEAGVLDALIELGFAIVGYGCMTCVGNSGTIDENIANAIEENNLVCCGVLSGNRNFEGRVHPSTRANYLASPLLVIAYAIAGTVDIDFETEPLGKRADGTPIYLCEIWPTRQEIQAVEQQYVIPAMFKEVYSKIKLGSLSWKLLNAPEGKLYPWSYKSTYIRKPPFFDGMTKSLPQIKSIKNARVLVYLGDSITTDHISPAGPIRRNSAAGIYLAKLGLTPKEFNTYTARSGNNDIIARCSFANIRLINKFMDKVGPRTLYLPTNEEMEIFDCAERYKMSNTPVIIIAGKDYGCGSSRDWAAKGPFTLGVKAVIAQSFERIHRSNLVGMGIVPLQFMPGQTLKTLGLTGKEIYDIDLFAEIKPLQLITVKTNININFEVIVRFDTEIELLYYKHGGILNYMIRKFLNC